MHSAHPDDENQPTQPRFRRRGTLVVLGTVLLLLLLVAILPPLLNVSRFQKRIAANISAALGRPVHFDSVSLKLLPLPGFTLKTFVIDEDPAFGFEPVLRADEVEVTLRISSLWHTHVEFSKIAFTEPSVNLVRAHNGKWNIESLLLQASHIEAAPTGQRFAGAARRFPYIEATGARLNLKLDQEKTPVSLTDADFALWLPEPHQWHLRLEAHPMRTDTSPGDTGTIRIEGTLGGADLNARSLVQIPIDLHGDWRNAQLGGIGRLLLGRDPGLRGDFAVAFALTGTVDHTSITTGIKLAKTRRADFVPSRMLSLDASCQAIAGDTFHSFTAIECRSPPPTSSDPALLLITANLPDVRQLRSASASLTLPALPADTLFDWLSVASPHPPALLPGAGTLAGVLHWAVPKASGPAARSKGAASPPLKTSASANPSLSGELRLSGSSLQMDAASNRSLPLGTVTLRSTPATSPPPPRSRTTRTTAGTPPTAPGEEGFDLLPVSLALGGRQSATIEGHFDATGYTLHLAGTALPATLLELAKAVPQCGDGLEVLLEKIAAANPDPDANPLATNNPVSTRAATSPGAAAVPVLLSDPIHIDLTATRNWGGPQTWHQTTPPAARLRHRSRR